MDNPGITEQIRFLEESLLHQDFTSSPEKLEAMVSADFKEINRNGTFVSRASVINWLLTKDPSARWTFNNFQTRLLSPELVQATYHAKQVEPPKQDKGSKGAIHSSLWQTRCQASTQASGQENIEESIWQLIFHQSTGVK